MAHNHAQAPQLNIDPEQMKPLFKTQVSRHALAILFDWMIIVASIVGCMAYFNAITYLAAVIIIGARQHALAILMHDATHYRFLKNRKWSDRVTNWLTMFPLFTAIETYRNNHLEHHKHLNSEEDPDWVAKLTKRAFTFPKTRVEFVLTVLSYLTLVQGVMDAVWFLKRFGGSKEAGLQARKTADTKAKLERLSFYVLLFTVLTITGGWLMFFLFWFIPYLSTFFMFQYIRSVAEHYGELAYDHALTSSRTVKTNFLERFLIAPHQVGYHLEHHLFPGVPFYHLPKLHKVLMEDPEYRGKAHVTQGYFVGLLQELGACQKLQTA